MKFDLEFLKTYLSNPEVMEGFREAEEEYEELEQAEDTEEPLNIYNKDNNLTEDNDVYAYNNDKSKDEYINWLKKDGKWDELTPEAQKEIKGDSLNEGYTQTEVDKVIKICNQIGIKTLADLKAFNEQYPGDLLTALLNYKNELGKNFRLPKKERGLTK